MLPPNNVNYSFHYFCFNNTEGLIPSKIVGSIGSSLTPSHASNQVYWFVVVSCLHMRVLYCVCVHILIPPPASKPSVVVWKCFIYSAIFSVFFLQSHFVRLGRETTKNFLLHFHIHTRTHTHANT